MPFIVDGDEFIGDSDTIIAYLIERYGLRIDDGLTQDQRNAHLLVRRTLDDLYWVMSFSRWKDPRSGRFFAMRCFARTRRSPSSFWTRLVTTISSATIIKASGAG